MSFNKDLAKSNANGSVSLHEGENGFPFVTLQTAAGASAKIYLYGAHVATFKDSKGRDHLFMSSKAEFKQGKALRGGIPICWPQFGPGKLPQHGFARNSTWQLNDTKVEEGVTSATFLLKDSEETKKVFPHSFELHYTVELKGDEMNTVFLVKNCGSDAFDWTGALHTYFNVAAIDSTSVKGLKGFTYVDKVQDAKEFEEKGEDIKFTSQLDRVYLKGASNDVHIQDTEGTEKVTFSSWKDVVVWNPWVEKAGGMSDLGEGEWKKYVCVEAVQVSDVVRLEPQQSWSGTYAFSKL
ncbi:hypothetical protein PROFUN_01373 [Planoprotostelium fungivorum]|uniref:glucose-6-phosphate 1-epimerase n=1 Tax=Planoprotostelium fungivorum TaxID=1890364 RepID=A0A2P6NT43_9EUKA|nr:hypothetical protein PROFUN_01373 [Planoprotostelium fungivorum]